MKKIIRPFLKLFISIASIIDKFIVVPITKLILRIMDFFKENAKTIDIMVSVCDAEKFKQEATDYLNSTPIKLSEYTISYEVNSIDVECSNE